MARSITPDEWERLGSRRVKTGSVELQVVEHGEGPLVVLCHGFPELGFSWRHQVFALAEAGYRTLTPDLRGYGGSSRPEELEAYDIFALCADLAALLDDAGAEDAIFVGHDWGASLVWQMALLHPDRVRAVAGLSVPATPRAPAPPMSILHRRWGDDFYMCWFQEPGVADAELARDIRRTLLSDDIEALQQQADPAEELPPPSWQSEEELGYFIRAFEKTGFTPALNYYRNIDRNWELTEHLDGRAISCPSLFVTGSEDPVGRFMTAEKLRTVLSDLRGLVVLEGAGHWIQQERPDEVTEALLDFFSSLEPRPHREEPTP